MANTANAYQVGQLIASLGLDDREFQRGMVAADASMKRVDASMKRSTATMMASLSAIGKKTEMVGKKMSMYLTLPILAVGGAAIKAQMDFEKSMSMIVGLVGIAREQVKAWEKDILKLAPALGRSPEELAKALFFITSAGVKGAAAMDVLNMSAKASVAGLGKTKAIADLVTSAMNAYGKENLSAAQATDILVATVREGKAEASALAVAMGEVLPVATEMGVTFDQVGSAVAAMTRTGTPVRQAVTKLKAILTSLIAPSKEAAEQMVNMGTSASELRKMLREDGLIQTLTYLRQATDQAANSEEAMARVFPEVEALVGVFALVGRNAKGITEIFDALADSTGSLDKALEAAEQTTRDKFDKAIAQVKSTLISLGNVLKDDVVEILQNVTERLRKITERWNAMSDAQQQVTIKMIALTAAIGPLLIVMGKLSQFIAANPYIALAGAVAFVITKLVLLAQHQKRTSKQQEEIQSTSEKVNEQYAEQSGKIKELVGHIEDENASNETRIAAINQLKEIMPDYNGELTKEGELIEHNTEAIDKYLESIKEKIRAKVYLDDYTEALTKQAEAERDVLEATMGVEQVRRQIAGLESGELFWKGMTEGAKSYDETLKNLQSQLTLGVAVQKILRDEYASTSEMVDALVKSMHRLDIDFTGVGTAGGGGAGADAGGGGGIPLPDTSGVEKSNEMIISTTEEMRDVFVSAWEEQFSAVEKVNAELYIAEQRYKKLTAAGETWKQTAYYIQEVFYGIGNAIGTSNQKLAEWVRYTGRALAASAKLIGIIVKIIAAKEAESFAGAVSSAMQLPVPANYIALAANVASVIAAFAAVPKFAEGGIVSGPTIAQVGEYPGAKSNPEVIAPLSKLNDIMQGSPGGLPREVRLRAEGRDLVGVLEFQNKYTNTY